MFAAGGNPSLAALGHLNYTGTQGGSSPCGGNGGHPGGQSALGGVGGMPGGGGDGSSASNRGAGAPGRVTIWY